MNEETGMEEKLNCLRCGSEMKHLRQEYIQLGKAGGFFGHWPNIIAGGLYVDILCCSGCGRLEFFTAAPDQIEYEEGQMAQTTCPTCGREHELDDPKCPFCGAKNPLI